METIDTIGLEKEGKTLVLKTYYDEDPHESPREWDNLGEMVCWHSRYNLGDKHDHEGPADFIYGLACDYFNWETIEEDRSNWEDFSQKEFVGKYLAKLEKHIFILPLYLYDHSGITMNTTGFSCPWDSGQVGWIYVTKEAVRKEWKVKRISPKLRKKAFKNLQGEVKTYNEYLTGQVYGYVIEDEEEEHIDSCWGFYGYDYMVEEAKQIALTA